MTQWLDDPMALRSLIADLQGHDIPAVPDVDRIAQHELDLDPFGRFAFVERHGTGAADAQGDEAFRGVRRVADRLHANGGRAHLELGVVLDAMDVGLVRWRIAQSRALRRTER